MGDRRICLAEEAAQTTATGSGHQENTVGSAPGTCSANFGSCYRFLTQEQPAKKAALPANSLGKVERGEKLISIAVRLRIANAGKLSISECWRGV
jgi:hypothetical protein